MSEQYEIAQNELEKLDVADLYCAASQCFYHLKQKNAHGEICDLVFSAMDSMGSRIRALEFQAELLESQIPDAKALCEKITDGRFCRMVEHSQDLCDCGDIAEFVRSELEPSVTGEVDKSGGDGAP